MRNNFKLQIEYDGSEYHGWQRQKTDRTVQGEIEKALRTMTREDVVLTGSGRTDAGVHALGQTANFYSRRTFSAEVFIKGLNSLLVRDIVIKECEAVDEEFHARFDAKSKTYHYRILNRSIPAAVSRQYSWFIRKPLDVRAMRRAVLHIQGTHDFKAFEGAGSPRAHTTRTVFEANLFQKDNGYLVFEIRANGFLRFMVRNIVGTLADVGTGKIIPDEVKKILDSKDRSRAGATAPPHGLFLMRVEYPE